MPLASASLIAAVAQRLYTDILDGSSGEATQLVGSLRKKTQERGLVCTSETMVVIKALFSVVSLELLLARVSHRVYATVCDLLLEVEGWLFPAWYRTRRHDSDAELLWGCLHISRSLLWLR